ncbi:MAG: hypothetical protein RIS64_4055 [Bacteroidota bacterium]|jgi:hypothetical protein
MNNKSKKMKKLILLTFCALMSISSSFAQSEAELKREIRNQVNSGFNSWSKQWSWDKYIDGSTAVETVGTSNDSNYSYVAVGKCTFSRGMRSVRLSLPFVAYINVIRGSLVVEKICYRDNSTGDSDCYNP